MDKNEQSITKMVENIPVSGMIPILKRAPINADKAIRTNPNISLKFSLNILFTFFNYTTKVR